MNVYEIPTLADGTPYYTEQVTLSGVSYRLTFRWSTRGNCWYLDLADADDVAIRTGVRIVTNWPLLAQCVDERRPAGDMLAFCDSDDSDPGLTDLGSRVTLVYVEP